MVTKTPDIISFIEVSRLTDSEGRVTSNKTETELNCKVQQNSKSQVITKNGKEFKYSFLIITQETVPDFSRFDKVKIYGTEYEIKAVLNLQKHTEIYA